MPLSLSRFPDHPNRSKLRGIHLKIKKPASIADELVASHEINLEEYEGKAIMVAGSLPEHKGWLYEASVIDQSGPILTEVVKELFK